MPLSKEHLQRVLAQLEADIGSIPAPKDVDFLIPVAALVYPSLFAPVPNPFTPENGKSYVFEFLNGDQVIQLPNANAVQPGFCFDVMGISLPDYAPPARLEIHPPADGIIIGPAGLTGGYPANTTSPIVMDAVGGANESMRLTFLGVLSKYTPLVPVIAVWKVDRYDAVGSPTKIVTRATTAALPPYTASGDYSNKVLTGNSVGSLTVDGTEVSAYADLILVKNEPENTSGDQGHNGIYRSIQTGDLSNPWKLRRASVWQSDLQIESVGGALIQVTEGAANAGKQFYINQWGKVPTEVAGGGGGGGETPLTDVRLYGPFTHSAAFNTCIYGLISGLGNGTVNLPALTSGDVGKRIWIKILGTSGGSTITVNGGSHQLDGVSSRILNNDWEWLQLRVVDLGASVYGWAVFG